MGEKQTPDFSGWATVNDQKCSDGRTIKSGAFAHMDKKKVPLVWQHQHNDPGSVLGHAILENRAFGVFCHGYFNETENGQQAKAMVKHQDIDSLSIFANNLTERRVNGGREVYHGDIREVSLVLVGANPGAVIENINIVHGDMFEELQDEAIIWNEQHLAHSDEGDSDVENTDEVDAEVEAEVEETDAEVEAEVTDESEDSDEVVQHSAEEIQTVFASFNEDQAEVVRHMLSEALKVSADEETKTKDNVMTDELAHANGDATVEEIFNTFTEDQKSVLYYMIGEALQGAGADSAQHSGLSEEDKDSFLAHINNSVKDGFDEMKKNLFEQNGLVGDTADKGTSLTHSQTEAIFADAQKEGSLKDAFAHAAQNYGIEDIDILFPDAQTIENSPSFLKRRTEWVADVLATTKHSPFSRIKSVVADITAEEARAKGYVKGNLKKDEVIKLLKRVTTPTTIYKKQKLDRDDIVDITSLDVVAWLKAEMRIMLDEEIARAILIGDGREPDSEDKIDEDHIRPIAYDAEMYAHAVTLTVNSANDIVEGILYARRNYKGTGNPTLYTTDEVLTDLLLQKDKVGRRLYETEESLAAALRVSKIVTVEVFEDTPEILAIIVNLTDYTVGADKGGEVSMFDDFDIDYNQYKYLIETRISGALTKPKSALVIKQNLGTVVTPQQPAYNASTHVITIPSQTGVEYYIDNVKQTAGPGTAITESTEVEARPATGYSFPHGTDADWFFAF